MQIQIIVTLLAVFALSACSSSRDTFYKHQPSGQPLEVPPDLTAVETSNTFVIPEISQVTRKKMVLENGAAVRLRKHGLLRWIEVDASPDEVWQQVKDFWLSNHVPLAWENRQLGIMETEWLTSYDSRFDLDRFRVRIEVNDQNKTEIYVRHRGKQQEFTEEGLISTWVDLYNDPELEVEVLGQLLVYLGLDKEQKEALLKAARKAKAIASLDLKTEEPHILIEDTFDNAWKLLIQAVDRAGHVITQRNKAEGWLEVRLVENGKTADFTPGFALSEARREILRLRVTQERGNTRVVVLMDNGQVDRSQQARDFLREVNGYL